MRRIALHRLVAVKGIRPAMIRGESDGGDPESRDGARHARAVQDVTRREMMTVLPATSNVSSLSSISPRGRSVHVGVNTRAHTYTCRIRACGSIPVSKDESASTKLSQFALDAMRMYVQVAESTL